MTWDVRVMLDFVLWTLNISIMIAFVVHADIQVPPPHFRHTVGSVQESRSIGKERFSARKPPPRAPPLRRRQVGDINSAPQTELIVVFPNYLDTAFDRPVLPRHLHPTPPQRTHRILSLI